LINAVIDVYVSVVVLAATVAQVDTPLIWNEPQNNPRRNLSLCSWQLLISQLTWHLDRVRAHSDSVIIEIVHIFRLPIRAHTLTTPSALVITVQHISITQLSFCAIMAHVRAWNVVRLLQSSAAPSRTHCALAPLKQFILSQLLCFLRNRSGGVPGCSPTAPPGRVPGQHLPR
jgi:hypothetical protein